MLSKSGLIAFLTLSALSLVCGSVALYYRGNAIDFKSQRDKAKNELLTATSTINDMQRRQQLVAALDKKLTEELADANTKNDRLRAKLAAGGRVRVAGECKPRFSTSGSVGDAGTVELSPVVGSNVLDIRAGIISDQAKVRYLQQYIREQCLK